MTTPVRDAGPADARAIAEVHVRSWRQGYQGLMSEEVLERLSVANRERAWRELLDGGRAWTQVVDAPDSDGPDGPPAAARIAGFVAVLLPARDDDSAPDTGEIAALYVDPEHWRRGVATALLRAALARLGDAGARAVTVWVLGGNAAAIAFYGKAGFADDGARMPHDLSGGGQVRYRLVLSR